MNVVSLIEKTVLNGVEKIFDKSLSSVEFVPTRKDFEGDITVVVFSLLKVIKGNPEVIGNQIGTYLQEELEVVKSFNVVKGFLNISLTDRFFLSAFADALLDTSYGTVKEKDPQAVMVEYSSPNTNKPLHLGHIRNNLLGYSVAQILEASGKKVYKTQIINDRGIHICKSMLAWQKFGHGETPESSGLKGDVLVGKYYVAFDKAYKEEVAALVASGMEQATAEKEASLLKAAQEMLIRWESGDDEVVALWKK